MTSVAPTDAGNHVTSNIACAIDSDIQKNQYSDWP